MVNYQNKCRLIKGWDDLFNKCKEHINQVAAMKLSPYFKVEEGGGACVNPSLRIVVLVYPVRELLFYVSGLHCCFVGF